ncbi:MAG: flagellar basal body P-ring formation protein FlgA [Cycloclasticus sp.]|nr:flagellar basal body P-ring formation protein FlgA [Cycloclasticus sp.]MBQ0789598.1 flagellar basal body P-ring formation protein FlgA [Cycloclasticus sp.]
MNLFSKIIFILLFFIQPALASEIYFEDHNVIKQQARTFLTTNLNSIGKEYTIQIHTIDPRLKLKKCPSPLRIQLTETPIKAGRNTLNIRCISNADWRIFMSSTIALFDNVVVAKKPMRKGHLIQRSDVHLMKKEITHLNSRHLLDPTRAVNLVLKKRLRKGDTINPNTLTKAILINRGDQVSILASNNGFTITMKGTALKEGGLGDKIRVKNTRTKKTIQAIVTNKTTVKVTL